MKPSINNAFNDELAQFKKLKFDRNYLEAWYHLERAHILSQQFVWPHIVVHLYMINWAWQSRNFKEILGQIPRILLAGPGSLMGLAPRGNTGGSNVGIFQRMEIPRELEEKLNS